MVYAGPENKGICPCCDLATARLRDGSTLVAFRNSDSGHRDIWLAVAPPGAPFGPPVPLGPDHWVFEGCPHDGPSLALAGNRLHAVWMSGHSGRNRLYIASSTTADLSFHPRALSPEAVGAQGHPKLLATRSGRVHAVWDESLDSAVASHAEHRHGASLSGSGRAVMVASLIDEDGRFGTPCAVAPRPGAFQLNPSVADAPDGALLVTFSEIDAAGKRIVVVRHQPESTGNEKAGNP